MESLTLSGTLIHTSNWPWHHFLLSPNKVSNSVSDLQGLTINQSKLFWAEKNTVYKQKKQLFVYDLKELQTYEDSKLSSNSSYSSWSILSKKSSSHLPYNTPVLSSRRSLIQFHGLILIFKHIFLWSLIFSLNCTS